MCGAGTFSVSTFTGFVCASLVQLWCFAVTLTVVFPSAGMSAVGNVTVQVPPFATVVVLVFPPQVTVISISAFNTSALTAGSGFAGIPVSAVPVIVTPAVFSAKLTLLSVAISFTTGFGVWYGVQGFVSSSGVGSSFFFTPSPSQSKSPSLMLIISLPVVSTLQLLAFVTVTL